MCSNKEQESCIENSDEQSSHAYETLTRRELRSLVFHMLYAADAYEYQESLLSLVELFNRGFELNIPHDSEVVMMAQAIIDERDALDEQLKPFLLNWRFERIGLCTKLILRLALWELNQRHTVPNIILNEAIELEQPLYTSFFWKGL